MDMSSSSSNSTSMMSMQMTFFTSTTTPLFSTSWTPSNTGQYAGTCIFLIILATLFKLLFALRAIQERRWQLLESKRHYVIAGAEKEEKESNSSERSVSSDISKEQSVAVIKNAIPPVVRPWRITQDGPRACFDLVIAGVGYLL